MFLSVCVWTTFNTCLFIQCVVRRRGGPRHWQSQSENRRHHRSHSRNCRVIAGNGVYFTHLIFSLTCVTSECWLSKSKILLRHLKILFLPFNFNRWMIGAFTWQNMFLFCLFCLFIYFLNYSISLNQISITQSRVNDIWIASK